MLSVVVASLLGLAYAASDCQYVLYDLDSQVLPLGINRCHYSVVSGSGVSLSVSFKYTCVSETEIQVTYYTSSFDCEGSQYSESYGTDEMTFDCSTSKSECGKLFGFKTPCDCTKENGDCSYAYALSIVDDTCVPYDSEDYQEWEITCGSVSKANAVVSMYSDSACNSFISSETTKAGCQTNSDYTYVFGTDEVDWIVCPGNFHTFSIALFVALIVAALSM